MSNNIDATVFLTQDNLNAMAQQGVFGAPSDTTDITPDDVTADQLQPFFEGNPIAVGLFLTQPQVNQLSQMGFLGTPSPTTDATPNTVTAAQLQAFFNVVLALVASPQRADLQQTICRMLGYGGF